MHVTLQSHKMASATYERNINQPKLLTYKSMPVLLEGNIAARKKSKIRTAFTSMGLAIPFQPSMWDEKSIKSVWNNGMEMVKAKLKSRYSEEYTNTILTRLEKLYPKLNYNTHRKSLAIVLTPDEEKIIYLSFPVKPVVYLSKSVSLLDLAANMQEEPDFYYFVLNKESASLYDYNNKQLRKVYEQNNETCQEYLFKNAVNIIERLNIQYEKPVFVTGRPNMAERFCNSSANSKQFFTLLYHATPFNTEIIQSLVKEITVHWSYWKSKFIKVKILLAHKEGMRICQIDAVLKALSKCADGILLVDKHLKYQLQKSNMAGSIFQFTNELMHQLEKFLVRGNRIEITESGLLKDIGGIVLLQSTKPDIFNERLTYRNYGGGGSLY